MMPGVVRTAANWRGAELRGRPRSYTRRLTPAEIEDLLALASTVDLDGGGPPEPSRSATDGPAGRLAAAIRDDLLDGLGFTMLVGFPIDALPYETTATAFTVLGSLVGGLRPQNADGHRLGHVIDIGADADDPTVRYYQTNRRQTFHTDSADAVALLCVRPAREGGESLLVSAEAVLEEHARRAPELTRWLFEPVATDRRGEVAPGEKPWFEIPVLTIHQGRLSVMYQRQYIDSAQRFDGVPALDDRHVAALDLFDEIMEEPDLQLRVEFAPGDMQFVHNHALLHDRTGFVDHPDPARRRHLMRLWLTLAGDRELPGVFADRYGSTTVGDRGGVMAGMQPVVFPRYPT